MKYPRLTLCAALLFLTACPDNSGPSKLLDQKGTTADTVDLVAAEVLRPADAGRREDETRQPVDSLILPDVLPDALVPDDVPLPEDVPEPKEMLAPEDTAAPKDTVEDLSLLDLSKEGKACLEVLACGQDSQCPPFDDPECLVPCSEGDSEMAVWELSLVADGYEDKCAGQPLEPDEVENCL